MSDDQARARAVVDAARGEPIGAAGPRDPALDALTIVVKTFERPCCVARLLASLRVHLPGVRVLVCDDSRAPLYPDDAEPLPGVRWTVLDFADGHTLGRGRNHLVDRAETPYVFLLDDDHVATSGTRLGAMLRFAVESGYDLVGGAQGREYGTAVFERTGSRMLQRFYVHHGLVAPRVVRCDRTSNVFVARTDAVRRVRWEERVYANEHADFFLRARAHGLRVAQMGGTFVEHDRRCERSTGVPSILTWFLPHQDLAYAKLRLGGGASMWQARRRARRLYREHVLAAHGVRDIVDVARRRDRRALEALLGPPDA